MSKFKFGDKVLNSDGVLGVVTNEIDGLCFIAWTCHELDEGWYRESELTPATDWVKCSEHLPDCDEFRANPYRAWFWIYCQNNDIGYVLKAYRKYQNGQWAWVSQLRTKGQLTFPDDLVTHYTPIEPPQPPQESQAQ